MFQTDGPLMRAQQPAFQQRDDPMDARQQFRRVALAAQDRDLTSVVFAVERQVAQPTIRMYHAARRNRLLHEGHQTARRSVRDATHANASDAPALFLCRHDNQGRGIGRIRMRRIADASAGSLMPFVEESIAPGSVVHTDGWLGYLPLDSKGYRRQITVLRGQRHPSELLPRVHRVISLLKRWLLGTHQGAVRLEHVDDYLNEFTFRFNRRRSRSRGKLFFRLVQQAMAVEPSTYTSIVRAAKTGRV